MKEIEATLLMQATAWSPILDLKQAVPYAKIQVLKRK